MARAKLRRSFRSGEWGTTLANDDLVSEGGAGALCFPLDAITPDDML